jgi:hypothetical protein
VLPKKVIWGLIAVSIFCRTNAEETTAASYWLGIFENKLVINDFWGAEDVAQRIWRKRSRPRITIK